MIQITSMKHDGSVHRIWHENIILGEQKNVLIGKNEHTVVTEANGHKWHTSGLAIFYFPIDTWFNIVILVTNKGQYSFYCNIASPFTMNNHVLTYTDYEIDIIVENDLTYQIVDESEYETNCIKWNYSKDIQRNVYDAIKEVIQLINNRQAPFNEQFVHYWYDKSKR